ncbi:hypothetical protein SERLA73DRAFT_139910 [Serpula lacrymans var. lacrymans S7.3]|uniref:Uncharacterized protein n=2 Tax=Serpula lacrymans var. lacrymans TaxID=341189 RepID=F8Q344_SERL3|nr:uncharacterized protein SERLADRAFT_394338 [Serpula lacrymans var. lacrymans S7.9]EGN97605.1 hypothetical protein SERLA73DRAFT_139910 [Serpula lacrymans var. lacrymans S7.3]EGO23199.1 hypothetical protein SERLADRAFT_394338 [Serpula lacrymans var. lacrymans S7.9]
MPPTSCAPELFDPLMGWHTYEQTLANPASDRQAFSGKSLWRLLQMGWLCREDEAKRWKEKDRKALKEHESRSIYPWKALKLPQPKKEDLIEVARKRFLDLNSAHLPESIKVTSTKAPRPVSPSAQDKKRAAEDDPPAPAQAGGGTSPQLKKRKMSTATPNATPIYPPTFVNGRPPKQFPAGNPSDPTPSPRHSTPAARSQTNSGTSLHFKASGVFTRRSGSPSKVNNVNPATPTDFASQARSPCDLAVNSAPS